MSVEEDVNIRLLDPRKLDSQGRKAISDMERIRKRLEQEAKKADKAINQMGGAPGDLSGLGGQVRGGTPGKISGQSGLVSGAGAPFVKSNPFKELREQVKKNTLDAEKSNKKLDLAIKGLGKVQEGVSDPMGLLFNQAKGKLPMSLLKASVIGTIVITIAEKLFDTFKKTFAAGGSNDVRKKILDEARTIPDLNHLIAIRNGNVFFSADTRIRQRVVQSSNTEALDVQSQRFTELTLGTAMSAG